MKKIYSMLILFALVCFGTLTAQADDLTLTLMNSDWTTQNVPVDGYNLDGNQHNQLLFLSNELSAMDGSNIKGLKFYFNRTGHSWSDASKIPTVTFRLAEVENTTLSSQVTVDESFTQVYSGEINFSFSEKEWSITFDAPYSYKGGNLLIDIQTEKNGSTYVKNSGSNYMKFYADNVTGRALKGSTAQSYCPKTTFTYEEAVDPNACNKPKNLAISAELPDGATFTWEQNADETVYQWACVTSGAEVETWNTLDADVRTKTVEGLNAGTAYDFYVRSYCGSEEDQQSEAVKKTFTPTCPAPTFGANPVTAKAATTATIEWNAADGISKYQYICVAKNATPNWEEAKEATTTSASVTDLTAYTEYDFYVRSWYSATSISDAVKTTFRTECAAVNAPKAWNFEEETAGATPGCWDNSASTAVPGWGSDDYNWTVYSYNSNKSLRMNNTSLKADGISLINSPSIVLPASPAQELTFNYSHRASCGNFTLKISTDGGANFTDLQSYSSTATSSSSDPGKFEEAAISLADYAGQTIILQFYAVADYKDGAIFVDNVDIHTAPSCAKPSGVTATATSYSTATVAWTNGGEEKAWNIRYSTDGENWTTIAADANPFGLTGLTANTTYQVQVQANCGEDQSLWVAAAEPLETPCAPEAIGWGENFDEATALPACWKADSYGNGNGQWYIYNKSARFNARLSSSYHVDLKTLPVTLSDAAILSFSHSGTSVTAEVYINAGEGDVLLKAIPKKDQKDTCDLSVYNGKTVYFIFRTYGYSAYSTVYYYIDDVLVSYKPVAAPTNVVATPADQSATITWESTEGTSWNLRYRVVGEEEWITENGLTATSKELSSLTNNANYEVQVQAVCSENRKSAWTASVNFTPVACPNVTAVSLGIKTYQSVVVEWTTSGATNCDVRYSTDNGENWTIAQENIEESSTTLGGLTVGTVYTIQVKPSCGDDETWVAAAETFSPVYTAPVADAASAISDKGATFSWSAVADAYSYEYAVTAREVAPAAWTEVAKNTVSVNTLDAATEYDFFVRTKFADDGVSAYDSIGFATITLAPQNLQQDGESTTDGATFTWEANGAATQYQWSIDNTNWSAAQTAITATVEGLNPGSTYTFYVRSWYADNVYSSAISKAFDTKCATETLPFEQDFGSVSGTKPNCWNIANWGTSANNWTTASDFAKTGVALKYNAKTLNSADAITPSIEISDKCELNFYIRNSVGSGSAKVEAKVLVNDGTETKELADITTRYTSATLQNIDLSDYVGKTITIIFRGVGYDSGTNSNLWIDDITITVKPCVTPTELAAAASKGSAVVTWTDDEADTWNLRYKKTADVDWEYVNNLDVKSHTLNSLDEEAEYEVQVQAVCSTTRSSEWTESVNFTPACPTPGEIQFSNKTYNGVIVSWTAGGAETAWNLEYNPGTGWTPVTENPLTTTSYTFDALETGKTYTFQVQAACGGDWTATATYTPQYSAPASASVTDATDVTATATWDAVADATNGYEYIVVARDAAEDWTSPIAVDETSASLTGLEGITEYDFYVRAVYGTSHGAATKAQFTTIAYAPQNLQQGATDTESAVFTWEANGAATQYQWSLDDTNWSAAQTALTAKVEGLSAGTAYTFYVRSYYADGKYSSSINLPFNTACDVESIGYTQDFEAGGKPLCWVVDDANWAETFSQGSTGNKWSNRVGSTTHSGNYALYYNSKTSTANSADITMPNIVIDKAAKLIFYIKNNYEVTGEVRVAAEEKETAITALKKTGNNFNTLQEIDLSDFVGKTVTITFHAQGAGTSENSSLAIDDIEVAPICTKPTNLEATATVGGADVTWDGDEDQYQYCVVNSGNDPSGWILLESYVKSVSITGKVEGKTYDVYVRAYCGAANQSEAVMTTFTTQSTPTGIDNVADDAKVIKLIENDQLVIIRDGIKYNAQGKRLGE